MNTCKSCKYFEMNPDFIQDQFGNCVFMLKGNFPFWNDNVKIKLVHYDQKYCKAWKNLKEH